MMKHRVSNESQAIEYITDCLLATVSGMASKKSKSKYEYERHIQIAQTAIDWHESFCIPPEKASRAFEIIHFHDGSVAKWAMKYEPRK
jgi:hypothetical protein